MPLCSHYGEEDDNGCIGWERHAENILGCQVTGLSLLLCLYICSCCDHGSFQWHPSASESLFSVLCPLCLGRHCLRVERWMPHSESLRPTEHHYDPLHYVFASIHPTILCDVGEGVMTTANVMLDLSALRGNVVTKCPQRLDIQSIELP